MILNKKLLSLLITLFILLIIPTSFANEDLNMTDDLNVSVDDEIRYLQSDGVYVDSSVDVGGNGTAESPVKTISEGLNLVNDGGTIYLTGTYVGEGNFNFTFSGTPNDIAFIGLGDCVIDGNFTSSFAVINSGTFSFENISFVNNYKAVEDTVSGGVFNNVGGKLTLTNCLFENNYVCAVNKTMVVQLTILVKLP